MAPASPISRETLARTIARLIPNLIRGAQLDFFQKRNITQTQFLVIVSIHSYGQCPMNRLASNMKVTMPTMTGVVDRLVEAGYVRRLPNPEDRRQVRVELTAKGRAFVQDHQAVLAGRWLEALKPIQDKEIAVMHALVEKMLAAFKDEALT